MMAVRALRRGHMARALCTAPPTITTSQAVAFEKFVCDRVTSPECAIVLDHIYKYGTIDEDELEMQQYEGSSGKTNFFDGLVNKLVGWAVSRNEGYRNMRLGMRVQRRQREERRKLLRKMLFKDVLTDEEYAVLRRWMTLCSFRTELELDALRNLGLPREIPDLHNFKHGLVNLQMGSKSDALVLNRRGWDACLSGALKDDVQRPQAAQGESGDLLSKKNNFAAMSVIMKTVLGPDFTNLAQSTMDAIDEDRRQGGTVDSTERRLQIECLQFKILEATGMLPKIGLPQTVEGYVLMQVGLLEYGLQDLDIFETVAGVEAKLSSFTEVPAANIDTTA